MDAAARKLGLYGLLAILGLSSKEKTERLARRNRGRSESPLGRANEL